MKSLAVCSFKKNLLTHLFHAYWGCLLGRGLPHILYMIQLHTILSLCTFQLNPGELLKCHWICSLGIKSMVLTVHIKGNSIYCVVTLKSSVVLQVELKLFIKLYFLLFNSTAVSLGKPPSAKPEPQTWYIHWTAHSVTYIIKKYTVYSGTKLRNDENIGNEGYIRRPPM